MNVGVVFETALLSPVLQAAFGVSDPFGQYGSTVLAESVARDDGAFTRLVDDAIGAAR